jgi:hypothetical protein
MTPQLKTRVENARKKCREAIALDEKRTTGEWEIGTDGVCGSPLFIDVVEVNKPLYKYGITDCVAEIPTEAGNFNEDAAFIAHASTFTGPAAKAMLGMLDALEEDLNDFIGRNRKKAEIALEAVCDTLGV